MFKKPFNIGQSHKVSGADRKKLRRALEKAFGLSEDAVEAVLPAKAGEVECVKLSSPYRAVLYVHDGAPVVLDPSGKGDYMPTVFALWRAPNLLPQVYIKHPAVSRYIVGGADLMLPGVLLPPGGLPPFQKDGLVAVCSPGNPCPVAVGRATMGSEDAVARIRGSGAAGPKGKLVELVQHYGDCLWSDLGARAVPNDGFLADGVVPPGAGSVEATLQGYESDGEDSEGAESGGESAGAAAAADPAGQALAAVQITDGGEGQAGPGGAEQGRQGQESSAAGAASTSGGGEGGDGGGDAVDMDSLLEQVLLQALHKSVKDTDLPLNSSVLWNLHLLPARPAGSTLDVKKSKHKKMSKFLQSYAKAGLLSCKEDKHSGDVIVTAINRKCELYTEYRPYKASATQAGAEAAEGNGAAAGGGAGAGAAAGGPAAAAAGGGGGGAGGAGAAPLVIEEVYKPGKELRPIFEELKLHSEGLYTASEAAEVAFAYVKAAGLDAPGTAPDNRTLLLNPTLCDALFKGLIKKGETFPTHLAKAELRDAFMRRMHLQCRVTRGHQQVIRKGQPPCVQVCSEKRQGNKRVTKIAGLEAFLVDPEQVAGACQRKFACSTSVVELPGKGAGHEVVLQGSFLDPVADFLMKQYDIPKKYFQVKK